MNIANTKTFCNPENFLKKYEGIKKPWPRLPDWYWSSIAELGFWHSRPWARVCVRPAMQWRASHGTTSVFGWDKLIPGSMWVVRAMWVCDNTTCAKSLVLCLSSFARNHWKVNREKRMWSTSFCNVVCINLFGTVCNAVDEIIRMTLHLSTLIRSFFGLQKSIRPDAGPGGLRLVHRIGWR